jgi:hypothetical protein
VQQLVRDARLPRSVKRRPAVKGVLLALADKCHDDGTNAWPSEATIAAEAEVSVKTARACLTTLRDLKLIVEEARPRQHKPRVWRLNLRAIRALEGKADRQHAAGLTSTDRQSLKSGRQDRESDAQILTPDEHSVADDPAFRIPTVIPLMNPAPAAINSRAAMTPTTAESDQDKERRLSDLRALKLRIFGGSRHGAKDKDLDSNGES